MCCQPLIMMFLNTSVSLADFLEKTKLAHNGNSAMLWLHIQTRAGRRRRHASLIRCSLIDAACSRELRKQKHGQCQHCCRARGCHGITWSHEIQEKSDVYAQFQSAQSPVGLLDGWYRCFASWCRNPSADFHHDSLFDLESAQLLGKRSLPPSCWNFTGLQNQRAIKVWLLLIIL